MILISGLLASTLIVAPLATPMRHYGLWSADRFLACAREAFGVPVFGVGDIPLLDFSISCRSKHDAAAELTKRGFRIFENATAVYLVPEGYFVYGRPGPYVQWRQIDVRLQLQEWTRGRDQLPLSAREQQSVAQVIYQTARTPPVAPPYKAAADGTGAVLEVSLGLVATTLRPAAESIIGIWGHEHGTRRIIYGEVTADGYRPLWDSPLLNGFGIVVRFVDVNADGIKEIAVTSLYGRNRQMLTVFDVAGNELTRQDDCVLTTAAYPSEAAVCPITGEEMGFEEERKGGRDIVVEDWDGTRRFRLVRGRYTLTH